MRRSFPTMGALQEMRSVSQNKKRTLESSSSAFSRSSGSQSSSTSCSADAIFLSLAAWPRPGPPLLPPTGEGDGGEAPANEGGMVREGCRFAISPQLHNTTATKHRSPRSIPKSPAQKRARGSESNSQLTSPRNRSNFRRIFTCLGSPPASAAYRRGGCRNPRNERPRQSHPEPRSPPLQQNPTAR